MKVNNIYNAFMGEVNVRGIGCPCTFVRLSGCNIRCYKNMLGKLCDTPEALLKNNGAEMSETDIVAEVVKSGRKLVCLTGGEPLMQDCEKLLAEFEKVGIEVVIETNGTKSIYPYINHPNASFVVDYKCSSSGYDKFMNTDNYELMTNKDFLKFVMYDEEDFDEFLEIYTKYKEYPFNFAIGTFWGGKLKYDALLSKLQKEGICDVYLNMQTHKMMCLYDKTGNFNEIYIPKDI